MIKVKCKKCGKIFKCNGDSVRTIFGTIHICITTSNESCFCKECTIQYRLSEEEQIKHCYNNQQVFIFR